MGPEEFFELQENSLTEMRKGERHLWKNVDLRVLLAVLSLAKPSISQAKVASLLKVSPVTLSRLVNSDNRDDHEVREAWIPTLTECLATVDIDTVARTATSLRFISNRYQRERQLVFVQRAAEKHFLKCGLEYKFDPEYWGSSYDTICFYSGERRWLFTLGSAKLDRERSRQTMSNMFSYYDHMSSIQPNDRISIVYANAAVFAEVAKFVMQQEAYGKKVGESAGYRSLVLCDFQKEEILEEIVISNLENIPRD